MATLKKIIIIGAKGTPVVIAEQILDAITRFSAPYELLGYAFDDESFGNEVNGIPIIDKTYKVYNRYKTFPDVLFVFSLYRSDLIRERIELRNQLGIPIERYLSFVHPTVMLSRSAKMGFGNIILANTVINPNVVLGDFNTINSGTLIGHDTMIGDSNFFAAHVVIGSNLNIGNGNFFGLNCSAKNFIGIGDYNVIGMAANVVKDTNADGIWIGNPAKNIR